ncbi:MAG TPA: response regulator transcription factor [Acidobacteria bacterium]|nr:response regulator transcription factor [Acidobacteriota bacterium]
MTEPETTRSRLLIVEDDELLASGLVRNLEMEGFSARRCATGEEALGILADPSRPFDLVVLDIMLPGMDGLEVCQRLRQAGNLIPILFLTARGSDADRILGLRAGADDYLTKPFLVEELTLRIRGILRRTVWARSAATTGPVIRIGDHTIDLDTMQAATNDGPIQLTERELMLIRFFAENEGRVLSRGELLERVWGYTFDTATRTLDTFIHRLRRYFETDPHNPKHFHTVRGVGYRFTFAPED